MEIISIRTSLVTSTVSVTCTPPRSDGLRCRPGGGCLIRCALHEELFFLFSNTRKWKWVFNSPPPFTSWHCHWLLSGRQWTSSLWCARYTLAAVIFSRGVFSPLRFPHGSDGHRGCSAGDSGAMSRRRKQFSRHMYFSCVAVWFCFLTRCWS